MLFVKILVCAGARDKLFARMGEVKNAYAAALHVLARNVWAEATSLTVYRVIRSLVY